MSSPCFPCPVREQHITSNQKSSASPMHPPNSPPPSQILRPRCPNPVGCSFILSIAHPPLLSVCVNHGLIFCTSYIPPGVDSPRRSGEKKSPPRVSWISPRGERFQQKKDPLPGGKNPVAKVYIWIFCGNERFLRKASAG